MNIKIFLERLQITPKVRDSGKWQVASARGSCFKKVEPSENDLFFVTVSSKSNLEAAMFGFFWGGGHASISCRESHDGVGISMGKMML